MVTDWSELTASEWAQYTALYQRFTTSRAQKDWPTADEARAELFQWQERGPDGLWHPTYEKPDHRQKRIEARGN